MAWRPLKWRRGGIKGISGRVRSESASTHCLQLLSPQSPSLPSPFCLAHFACHLAVKATSERVAALSHPSLKARPVCRRKKVPSGCTSTLLTAFGRLQAHWGASVTYRGVQRTILIGWLMMGDYCFHCVCVYGVYGLFVNSAKSDYKKMSTTVVRLLIIVTTYWIPTRV